MKTSFIVIILCLSFPAAVLGQEQAAPGEAEVIGPSDSAPASPPQPQPQPTQSPPVTSAPPLLPLVPAKPLVTEHYAMRRVIDFGAGAGFWAIFSGTTEYDLEITPEIGWFPASGLRLGFGPTILYDMIDPPGPGNKIVLWGVGLKTALEYYFYTKSIAFPYLGFNLAEHIVSEGVGGDDTAYSAFSIGLQTGLALAIQRGLISIGFRWKWTMYDPFAGLLQSKDSEHVISLVIRFGFWVNGR